MASFKYKARTPTLEVVEGVLEADDELAVRDTIIRLGMHPLEIAVQQTKTRSRKRVKADALAVFAKELSVMIRSGLTTDDALRISQKQQRDSGLGPIIGELLDDVSNGMTLSAALSKHPRVFNGVFVSMVRTGEASGEMANALENLSDFINKENWIKGKLTSAMMYPGLILTFAVFATLAMLLFVFPQLENLYAQLEGELPGITKFFLATSDFLRGFWFIWVPISLALVVWAVSWSRTPKGRRVRDKLSLKIPLIGPFIQQIALTKFSKTLASLLQGGTRTVEALVIAGGSSGNALIEDAVDGLVSGLREGERVSHRMAANEELFTTMLVQVMAVGEETGSVTEMLAEVVEHYENEVDRTAERLGAVLDPILMVIMLAIVGTMLMGLYLPIFNMSSLIQGM